MEFGIREALEFADYEPGGGGGHIHIQILIILLIYY